MPRKSEGKCTLSKFRKSIQEELDQWIICVGTNTHTKQKLFSLLWPKFVWKNYAGDLQLRTIKSYASVWVFTNQVRVYAEKKFHVFIGLIFVMVVLSSAITINSKIE